MTELNAVFEGGGVKGIALVGALARAEQEGISIKGFAGSSAGAIVAALASVGYRSAELKGILQKTNYIEFLDGNDVLPLSSLKGFLSELEVLFEDSSIEFARKEAARLWTAQTGLLAPLRTWWAWKSLKKRHGAVLKKIEDKAPLIQKLAASFTRDYGLYGTETFLRWIQDHLNRKGTQDPLSHQVTFGTLFRQTQRELKILAADVGARSPFLYSYQNSADLEVAQAVQASMSIPFFFKPFPFGNKYFVDGGTISNFPAWTFDRDSTDDATDAPAVLPVLGFRLVPETLPRQTIGNFKQFGVGVVQTALGGTDLLQTRRIAELRLIKIPIPLRITATTFDLSDADSDELYYRGEQAADRFFRDPDNRSFLELPVLT
jgi:NTE family protein